MGKSRNGKITERQLRMVELRAEGKTLEEVGAAFGITAPGARVNINEAMSLIRRHGLEAVLSPGCVPRFTEEALFSSLPEKRYYGPRLRIDSVPAPLAEDTPVPNRFLRINGENYSLDTVVRALGVFIPENESVQVSLCQRVDAGILVAKGAALDQDDYPGIDVELELSADKDSIPIMISRTEQPRPVEEEHALRTFCYDRTDEYFMCFDVDVRPDREVEEHYFPPELIVSGSPDNCVVVSCENQYVDFQGVQNVTPKKESLQTLIQAAASKTGFGTVSERGVKPPERE